MNHKFRAELQAAALFGVVWGGHFSERDAAEAIWQMLLAISFLAVQVEPVHALLQGTGQELSSEQPCE